MVPRENKNNAYTKFGGGGARSIMIFSEMDNFQWIYLKLCVISLEPLYLVNCSDFGKNYLSGF